MYSDNVICLNTYWFPGQTIDPFRIFGLLNANFFYFLRFLFTLIKTRTNQAIFINSDLLIIVYKNCMHWRLTLYLVTIIIPWVKLIHCGLHVSQDKLLHYRNTQRKLNRNLTFPLVWLRTPHEIHLICRAPFKSMK